MHDLRDDHQRQRNVGVLAVRQLIAASSVAPITLPRPGQRLTRFAVTTVAIVEDESASGAAETIGRALLDAPVQSVVVLQIDAPVGVPVPPLELHEAPAALAFHCLNTAAQILRGDELADEDRARASELLAQGTVHVGALYLETIREHRRNAQLHSTSAWLAQDKSDLAQSVVTLTRQLDEAQAVIRQLRGEPVPIGGK